MHRVAEALRCCLAGLLVTASALLCTTVLRPADPGSTPIRVVDSSVLVPATPAALSSALRDAPSRDAPSHDARSVRIAFVGDIMQHHAQADDDFQASYAEIARVLSPFDAVVGNLEFPVDSTRPVGPMRGGTTFNGSGAHVSALAAAGFTVLSVANNHAFDQGPDGFGRTVAVIRARGMVPLGVAAPEGGSQPPVFVNVRGVKVALLAYTIPPNPYVGAGDTVRPVPRTTPLTMLNFRGWEAEFRKSGQDILRGHAAAARGAGAQLLVAIVHWGEEWHLHPTSGQITAAHDIIDAGFDVVVGSHPHVLQGSELYRGGFIAYSLGNFNSDFSPLATRTGAILELDFATDSAGAHLSRFGYVPITVKRRGHVVVRADSGSAEWRVACRILGAGVRGCG